MMAVLLSTEAEHNYEVSDVSTVRTDSRRPMTIRPDRLKISTLNGHVSHIGAAGVTVRRDGTDGARRMVVWLARGGYAGMPHWAFEVLASTGLPSMPARQSNRARA